MSQVMEGKEFTLWFLPVSEVLIPFVFSIILTAGAKVAPPSVDLANPIAVSALPYQPPHLCANFCQYAFKYVAGIIQ